MRRLLPLLVGLTVLMPTGPAIAASPAPRVVVLGVPGLRWSDVNTSDMPALAALASRGATGVLSIRTAGRSDCQADAWLTLGAGNRVVAPTEAGSGCGSSIADPTVLPAAVTANAHRREGAEPGLLASTLEAHGRCVSAEAPSSQPGASALGATDPGGRTTRGPCDVLLISTPAAEGGDRGGEADGFIDAAVRDLAPGSTLIVLGVGALSASAEPHLHVAIAVGPHFRRGALTSASTRRSPYVQLVDVAPTILSLLDVPRPDAMIGEPMRATGSTPSVPALRDLERQSDGQRQATVPFFVVLVGLQLLGAGVGLLLRRWRLVELVALAGTTAVGASYLANLIPWWRAGSPLLAMLAVTAAATALLTPLCLLSKGSLARAGIACGSVAAVLVVDLLTGAHLQMASVAGYSPVVAGRFAGLGNVAFGVLAASVLLAAASTRSATVAALTALVVVVDGAPSWGSDVGGVLALVPAYALLVLQLAGKKVNVARLGLAAAGGVLVVVAFGVADHARPTDQQTHLGRFVGQVLDGTAGGVIRRKAAANLALLFHSPVTALLPLVVAFLLVLFLRPPRSLREAFERSPAWRAGLLAVCTASGLGFLLNDSGAAVPALAIVVALPATLAVLARHARSTAAAG